MIPGSSTNSSGRGRPAKKLPAAVQAAYHNPANAMQMDHHNCSSRAKVDMKSNCSIKQHRDFLAVDTVHRHSAETGYKRECTMCSNPPSQLAALAYDVCLMTGQMHRFAAEAYAAYYQPAVKLPSGHMLAVGSLPYDIMSLEPANLVIEVMGKQHDTKLMTYANSNEMRGVSSSHIDEAKKAAAMAAGYSVVWLMAGEQRDRVSRWLFVLLEALAHVDAGLPPKHFSSL